MRRLLLALLLCAACKHASSSSTTTHSETSTVTDTKTSESGTQTTVTTTTEAPSKTTTTVDEFAPPTEEVMPSAPDASAERGRSQSDPGAPATSGVVKRPRHGPLVKRTVTVTEHGQETTETHQQATTQAAGATETKAAGKVDTQAKAAESSAPAASCAFLGAWWIFLVVGALFLLAAGFLRARKII